MLYLDFETYFSSKDKYSLRSKDMTIESYIRDPRFEVISLSLAVDDADPNCYYSDDANFVAVIDFIRGYSGPVVSHNALFDMSILAWHFNIYPKFIIDTLAMARATGHKSNSLKSLAELYGLQPKLDTLDKLMNGKRTLDLTPDMRRSFAEYNNRDVVICRGIYSILKSKFPISEFRIMHITAELFTRPVLHIDNNVCITIASNIGIEQQRTLSALNVTLEELRSKDKFAALLLSLGVVPPTKPSPADPDKTTYAFAKTDQELLQLLSHSDPRVASLVEAKIGNQSSLRQSRALRFANIAERSIKCTGSPLLPIPLSYYGAQNTGRFSGTDSINLQNLPRGKGLRSAIIPPPGSKLVIADYSAIEARVLAFLAEQESSLSVFRSRDDIYAHTASNVYGINITKQTHPGERNVGKVLVLGLGYNMGAPKFASEVFKGLMGLPSIQFTTDDATRLGVDISEFARNAYKRIRQEAHMRQSGFFYPISPRDIIIHCAVADHLVTAWRNANMNIVRYWELCSRMLSYMANGIEEVFGPIATTHNAIVLPNSLKLHYPDLCMRGTSYMYNNGKTTEYIYGGKLAENITQALSRIIMTDSMLEVSRLPYSRIAFSVHDELVQVTKINYAQQVLDETLRIMRESRKWYNGAPLDAEGWIVDDYGSAK